MSKEEKIIDEHGPHLAEKYGVEDSAIDVPVYFINMDRRKDRLETMLEIIKKHKIAASRIAAMDGSLFKGTLLEKGKLRLGEVGCLMSHIVAWTQATDPPNTILIMEDDVILHPNFSEQVNLILQDLKTIDFDIVLLGRNFFNHDEVTRANRGALITSRLFKPEWIGYGAHCYLLSPKGAQKLLEFSQDFQRPTDVIFTEESSSGALKVLVSKTLLALPMDIGDSDTVGK